jgi:hypothetical protein
MLRAAMPALGAIDLGLSLLYSALLLLLILLSFVSLTRRNTRD